MGNKEPKLRKTALEAAKKSVLEELSGRKASIGKLVMLCFRGSYVDGCFIEGESDLDAYGVYLAPGSYYIGLDDTKRTTIEFETDIDAEDKPWTKIDVVLHEFRHFVRQLLKGNPSAITALYLPSEVVFFDSEEWAKIREARSAFLALKPLGRSFWGNAHSFARKMRPESPKDEWDYDGKAATGVLRVLSRGTELLTQGYITYPRPDGELWRMIRRREVPFSTVDTEIERASVLFYGALLSAWNMPLEPDHKQANALVEEVLISYLLKDFAKYGKLTARKKPTV